MCLPALRLPYTWSGDPHPTAHLRESLHDGGRGHTHVAENSRILLDHRDYALCAPVAGASGIRCALLATYSIGLPVDLDWTYGIL